MTASTYSPYPGARIPDFDIWKRDPQARRAVGKGATVAQPARPAPVADTLTGDAAPPAKRNEGPRFPIFVAKTVRRA